MPKKYRLNRESQRITAGDLSTTKENKTEKLK